MPRRQQLLGKLEEPPRRKRQSTPEPESQSTRYPPEVKAKAYSAYLDGASWADCARAIGHHDPNGSGSALIQRWAEEDQWQREDPKGGYKTKVQRERAKDPAKISDDIDALCIEMQDVAAEYITQFRDEESGKIVIPAAFKTRDFADMAAALRMIHETRIKIRKANDPKDGDKGGDKGGDKKKDFLSMIREAGAARIRDNRRFAKATPEPATEEPEDAEDQQQAPNAGDPQPAVAIPNLAEVRARLESASRPDDDGAA